MYLYNYENYNQQTHKRDACGSAKRLSNACGSGVVGFGIGASFGALAPNFDKIGNLGLRYAAKAGYSALAGAFTGAGADLGAQFLAVQSGWQQDYNWGSVGMSAITGGAMGAGISLGFSAYDFATWDRYSSIQKVDILNKKNSSCIDYLDKDYYDQNFKSRLRNKEYSDLAGVTNPDNTQSYITDAGLKTRQLANITVTHESMHSSQYSLGLDGSSNRNEMQAYYAERSQISNMTQQRYIKNSQIQLNNLSTYQGGIFYKPNWTNYIMNIR